ncbi:hypothetical protein [Mesorhizobium sp. B2-3-4]|uniref:hypothetical protein n=1 Tax=Mesorhizobium sp. B2-3-4 TaxID=2589959 RepID=UPI00112CB0BF|nr:hypothetical protein [Mesorhizobium sp. B2-3-4]TPM39616.1 hypothetical protein FJ967_09040 [Mesorhizobium sp. B2-3-4]
MNAAALKYSDVKAGDRLIADGGFDCIKANEVLTVRSSVLGSLYVPCGCGKHFLDGQEGDDGKLIGFRRG